MAKRSAETEMITTTSDDVLGNTSVSDSCSKKMRSSEDQPVHNGRKLIVMMQTAQCLQFKSLIECLKDLLVEVNLEFIEDTGIRIIRIDPGHIGMVHLVINNVEYFYVKGGAEKKVVCGLNMGILYKMIRGMSSSDLMEWRVYEDEPNTLHIELSNTERRTKTVNSIKLLDLDDVELEIPSVEFDRVVSMPSGEFSKHVREMSSISKYVTIRGTKNSLELYSSGENGSSFVSIEPTASGLNWRHSEGGKDIEGKYFCKYIDKFAKAHIDNNVELFMKEKFPLVLRFEVSIGNLRFIIAPVEEDECDGDGV